MKINQNRPETKQVPVNVINTMLEQISNLQTDVATLQNEVDGFDQSVDTVNIEATQAAIDAINATNISSTNATINNITASGNVDIANLDANTADIDTATIGTETVGTSTITDATIATAKITDLDTVTGAVQHLSAGNIEADSVDVDTITTEGITNSGNYTGMDATLIGDLTVNGAAKTGGLHVHGDLNVDGQVLTAQEIIGARELNVANFHADDSSLVRAEIDKLGVNEEYLREVNALVPSPSLVSDSDRYTIELPRFTGVMKLVWMDGAYQWTATVIGNGRDYCVTWSSYAPNEMYITQLFQWASRLYIRHKANGKLYYSYSAEREITQSINIYYNMGAWPYPKSLEELCDEHHKVDVTRPAGTVWFGAVKMPMLEDNEGNGGVLTFKGSTAFSGLPSFSDVMPGDVWNITDESYTDERFVDGAGKPINAGDDIVAVEVDGAINTEQITPALYANGDTWYCDGTSVYKNSADVTPYGVAQYFNLYVCNNTVWLEGDSKLYKYNLTEWTLEAEDCTLKGFYGNNILIYFFYTGQYKTSDVDNVSWSDFNGPQTSRWNPLIKAYVNDTLFFSDTDSDGGCIWWGNGTDNWNTYEPSSYDVNIKSIGNNVFFVGNIPEAIEIFDWNANQFVSTDADYTKVARSVSLNNKGYYGGLYESTDGLTWTNIGELPEGATITDPGAYMSGYSKLYALDGTTWYEVILTGEKSLKWDKFAAGVNYENFVAYDITATHALKSEGTLEVDGASTLHNTTITGNITQTGNQNVTGNETIIGKVTIGDLD